MTGRTAAEMAAEALREAIEVLALSDPEGRRAARIHAPEDEEIGSLCERVGYGAVMDSAARLWRRKDAIGAHTTGAAALTVKNTVARLNEALAALTAESAREAEMDALTDKAVAEIKARVSPDREALARELVQKWSDNDVFNEDVILEQIVNDITAAALRLPAQAEVEGMAKYVTSLAHMHDSPKLHEAAAMLRRLASLPPAVGEWRPIATFDETDASKFDFWLDWADDCAKLNAPLAETSWAGENLFRGYHRCWPSYLKATHWMPLPPTPPQETKP